MKKALLLFLIAAFAGALGAAAQTRPDYLTREEVTQVRDTQEPEKRITLFLEFAEQRLARFEEGLRSPDTHRQDLLRDRLNDFISAIDDAAASLDLALERGGVDLRKTREKLSETIADFQARVESARQSDAELREGDLRYDVEDALMAMQDFLDLGQQIPDQPMPPKLPQRVGAEADEQPSVPGRPTLKRRSEEEEKKPD